MRRLTVHRKSFRVKGHYSHSHSGKRFWIPGHRVKSSRFRIKDRGNPGRGKKIVPRLKSGALGGKGFFSRSYPSQRHIVFHVAKVKGERTAIGRLAILQNFFKNTKPSYAARAKRLRTVVAGSFMGKRQVMYPQGFKRRR